MTTTPKRILKAVGIVILVAVALVVFAVGALLTPAVRVLFLPHVITLADNALPGRLTVGSASWPGLGTIELGDFLWTDGDTTLVSAERIAASVKLRSLARRDVEVENVELRRAYANVPRIAARFSSDRKEEPAPANDDRGFVREGSLAGMPSVAVERAVIGVDSIRLSGERVVSNVALDAAIDLVHGREPRLHIERAQVVGAEWGVDSLALDVDFRTGQLSGFARGAIAPAWPVALTLSPAGADAFDAVVEAGTPGDANGRLVASLRAKLTRKGFDVGEIVFDAGLSTPGTQDLATLPWIGARFATLPTLEGLVMRATGTLRLKPVLGVDVDATVEPNAWIGESRIALSYRNSALVVRHGSIRAPGFSLDVNGRLDPDSLRVRAALQVVGDDWLRAIRPGTSLPEPLELDAVLRATSGDRRTGIDARLEATGRAGGFGVESLQLAGELARDRRTPSTVRASIRTFGHSLGVAGQVVRDTDVTATVSPLIVRDTAIPLDEVVFSKRDAGTIVFNPSSGGLRVDGVRVIGVYGGARVNADLDGDKAGSFAVDCNWPTPPAALTRVLTLDASQSDSLDHRWQQDGPFDLAVRGELAPGGETRADGHFRLPGPATWRSLLPDSLNLGGLHAIEGTASVSVGKEAAVDAAVNLSLTSWIDSLVVRLRKTKSATRIDSLRFGMEGLTLRGAATVEGDAIDAGVLLEVADTGSIRRFVPGVPDARLHLDAHVKGTAEDLLLKAAATGAAPDLGLADFGCRVECRIDTTGGRTFLVDTLNVSLSGENLVTTQPFRVTLDSGSNVMIGGLSMTGSIGSVRLNGSAGRENADLEASAHVRMPDLAARFGAPDHLWPKTLDADLFVRGPNEFDMRVRLAGFVVAETRRPPFNLVIKGSVDSVGVAFSIADTIGSILNGTVHLPASAGVYPPSVTWHGGDVAIDVFIDSLPIATRRISEVTRIPPGKEARLDGRIVIRGKPEAPSGTLEAEVTFPGWPKLSDFRARIGGAFGPDRDITANVSLEKRGAAVLTGSLDYPATIVLAGKPTPVANRDTVMKLEVESAGLSLDDFDVLLPLDIGLSGRCDLNLTASGPVEEPTLRGRLVLSKLDAAVAQVARAVAGGQLDFAGTLKTPKIGGQITVEQGLIQVPDLPENLHPIEGDALLVVESVDSTREPSAEDKPDTPQVGGAEVDVTVSIPSSFFIRGKGLDIEFGGELRLRLRGMTPTVTGELRALRGSLALLGRRLELEHGSVKFDGSDNIDPSLAVSMETAVGETHIRIQVGGTARKPEIVMSSQPEMKDEDIVAVLLFGKTYSELNDDQAGHLRNRSTEIAFALGAAQLQKQAGQFGVDVISYQGAESERESGSLQFGKYLSPQVLLSYIRSLESDADSVISLEYFLKGRFKVESLYGRRNNRNQSAVGVGWVRDY